MDVGRVHEGHFEDDEIMDRQPVRLLQAVNVIKGGVKENKRGKFILILYFPSVVIIILHRKSSSEAAT